VKVARAQGRKKEGLTIGEKAGKPIKIPGDRNEGREEINEKKNTEKR